MGIRATKWGDNLGVRIPRVFANKIGLHEGMPVTISVKDHHSMIRKSYTLTSLIVQITPENIHKEINLEAARMVKKYGK